MRLRHIKPHHADSRLHVACSTFSLFFTLPHAGHDVQPATATTTTPTTFTTPATSPTYAMTAMAILPPALQLHTEAILRLASPALVLLAALSVLPARPPPPSEPSPITSVVVATRAPRRALILSFLSLAGLSYLADGLTFVVYAVLSKEWPHKTGIDIGAVEGVVAFFGLAALGAWKDVHGVDVWSTKRVKAGVLVSLLLDVAIALRISQTGMSRSKFRVFTYSTIYSPSTPSMAPALRIRCVPRPHPGSSRRCTLQPAGRLHPCPEW